MLVQHAGIVFPGLDITVHWKTKKTLIIFLIRKYLKAISSVKPIKKTKPFQRKNINFWNHFISSFWIYTPVDEKSVHRKLPPLRKIFPNPNPTQGGWFIDYFVCTTHQFNSGNMGRTDKQKAAIDLRFAG